MGLSRKTAAALIIGDEILSGKTLDKNTQALAQFLFSHGVVLKMTQTIPDDIPTICNALQNLSNSHDIVFTSGGIGPTPDDMTYEAVAKAFNTHLDKHEPTVARMRDISPQMDINESRMRMARIPANCDVFWTDGLWVPLVYINKTFVLPGIPSLFTRMLESIPIEILGSTPAKARMEFQTTLKEGDLADVLEQTGRKYEEVAIGSYPRGKHSDYRTLITVTGDDDETVKKATAEICEKLNISV